MDTISRRELFRRVARAAVIGPAVLATRDQQADLLFRLGLLFGKTSLIRRWFWELSDRWW